MTDTATQAPTTTETPLPLPRYRCHKVVEALKIEHIVFGELGGGATIHPADTRYPPFKVAAEYVAKHGPRAGGYWVRYEDIYESFSPAKALEEGYTLIVPPTKPTIAELEKLLEAEGTANITINTDGSISAAASQPMPIGGQQAAQNLYPAQPGGETTVSDPDTHA